MSEYDSIFNTNTGLGINEYEITNLENDINVLNGQASSYLLLDGTRDMTGDLNLGNTNDIINVDNTTTNKIYLTSPTNDFNGCIYVDNGAGPTDLALSFATTIGTIIGQVSALESNAYYKDGSTGGLSADLLMGTFDIQNCGHIQFNTWELNGTSVSASASDLNKTTISTNGQTEANKFLSSNVDKDVWDIRNLTITGAGDFNSLETNALTVGGVPLDLTKLNWLPAYPTVPTYPVASQAIILNASRNLSAVAGQGISNIACSSLTSGSLTNPNYSSGLNVYAFGTHTLSLGNGTNGYSILLNTKITTQKNIEPSVDITHDLGTLTKRYNNIYGATLRATTLNATNIGAFTSTGDITIPSPYKLWCNTVEAPASSTLNLHSFSGNIEILPRSGGDTYLFYGSSTGTGYIGEHGQTSDIILYNVAGFNKIRFNKNLDMNTKDISAITTLTATNVNATNLGATTMAGTLNLAGQALNNIATCTSNNTMIFATSNGYIDLQCSSGQKVYIQQYGGGSMFEFSASTGNKTYQNINMNNLSITSCLAITSTTGTFTNLSATTLQGSMNVNAQTLTNVARIDIDNTNAYLSFYTGGGIKTEVWRLGTNSLTSIGSSGTLDGIGTIKGYSSEMIFRDSGGAIKLKLNGNGVDFNGVQAYSAGGIYFANDPTNNYIAETNTPYHLTLNGVYDMKYYVNKSNANASAKHRFYHYTTEIVAISSTSLELNSKTITGATGLYGSTNLDIIYTNTYAVYFKNSSATTKMTISDTAIETINNEVNFKNTAGTPKISFRTNTINPRMDIRGPDTDYYSTILIQDWGDNKYGIESVANSTSLSYHMLIKDTTNGLVGSIVSLGGVTAFNTTSDYRAKRDVREMDYKDSYKKLQKIKPCHYKFITDSKNTEHSGFIAHELKEIIPTSVTGEKDAFHYDKDGKKVDDYQAVDYSKLVPDLICVVKGLMKENKELSKKLSLAVDRIDTLEKMLT